MMLLALTVNNMTLKDTMAKTLLTDVAVAAYIKGMLKGKQLHRRAVMSH